MISLDQFYQALTTFRPRPDTEQRKAIEPPPDAALFIVAGPGSGKTTCLTVRILKLILVDDVPPVGILATTFTKKAAEELRSRILGWGFRLIDTLLADPTLGRPQKKRLGDTDINQVWTGTLDSLSEQLLRDFRAPGTQPPILADEFVAATLLLRQGLLNQGRYQDADLDQLLLGIHAHNRSRFGYHVGTKAGLLQTLWDRRHHDQIDWNRFIQSAPPAQQAGYQVLDAALSDYANELQQRGMVDFARLEHELLQRLVAGQLIDFTQNLRVVLVDEYQDTNLLQEQIYFEFAQACGGALGVVGDDDQSLYRFRGATVDLFSNFAARYQQHFPRTPQTVFLNINYRSTQTIIRFVNDFATLDHDYQTVRVAQKPALVHAPTAAPGLPVLGLFRDTLDELADDLAGFIHDVFRGNGYRLPNGQFVIRDNRTGDLGDCALLCSSPAEYNSGGNPRLPLLLRQKLGAMTPAIAVFNPRGEDFSGIPLVERFGGLLAECLDPGGTLQGQLSGFADAGATLNQWRQRAIDYANDPATPPELVAYASGWRDRDPQRPGLVWPRSVAVIELVYGLLHYFPDLHDDPEGQIYLEVFTRQLSACEQIGKFHGRLAHDPANPGLSEASIKELLRDFLGPIATGTVKVDEELIESFPRDRLSVLSIHQAKGLEFPLTIVDIGSDFRRNHHANAFKRFPNAGGPPHRIEDLLRPYSPLGTMPRRQIDRAFDDLYRQFFVAYSRPQDVLLLVGLRASLPGGSVQNIAAGCDRTGRRLWQANALPLVAI